MAYPVEFADEFEEWWDGLNVAEQISVSRSVSRLIDEGPTLPRPYSDTLYGSKFPNMKELRVKHEGRHYRVLYAFDPRRCAMLLIGGDKTGKERWYREFIPKADAIFAQHLRELDGESANN